MSEMPDRYGDSDTETTPETTGVSDTENLTEVRTREIAQCGLCDDDGYRGAVVCDHVDHETATTHGRGLVQGVLADIARRKAERARS